MRFMPEELRTLEVFSRVRQAIQEMQQASPKTNSSFLMKKAVSRTCFTEALRLLAKRRLSPTGQAKCLLRAREPVFQATSKRRSA